ncbi:MAG TPA: glycosyltransferase family 2 protein [Streptosporangiaceae bacterium]|jgi:glycosyltransferase involved in cell wall biosynthesis|nr:glycosyltransferase family 2 protein [Streptosporangiaceae bacterium]
MTHMMTPVDVVLPCHNEAEALPAVIAGLPPGFRALVVDNASTDATAERARELGARVVHEGRLGYGAAVHTGLEHASTELVAFLDGDGSLDAGVLPELAGQVAAGQADLAVGRRRPVCRGAQPWHARAGNAVLAARLRQCGVPVHDIAPVRLARRRWLLDLGVTDRGFGYPLELLLRTGAAAGRIYETDVAYGPRAGGRSKVSGSVTGTLRAVRDMGRVMYR